MASGERIQALWVGNAEELGDFPLHPANYGLGTGEFGFSLIEAVANLLVGFRTRDSVVLLRYGTLDQTMTNRPTGGLTTDVATSVLSRYQAKSFALVWNVRHDRTKQKKGRKSKRSGHSFQVISIAKYPQCLTGVIEGQKP